MATVRVAVKYSNREFLRIYDVSRDDAEFEVVKDAIKATGARFDGGFGRKWWVARKSGLNALKDAGYTVKSADFEIDARRNGVVFTATSEVVARVELQYRLGGHPGRLRGEDWERLARYRDELQAAYNESDDALAPVLARIHDECARPVVVD